MWYAGRHYTTVRNVFMTCVRACVRTYMYTNILRVTNGRNVAKLTLKIIRFVARRQNYYCYYSTRSASGWFFFRVFVRPFPVIIRGKWCLMKIYIKKKRRFRFVKYFYLFFVIIMSAVWTCFLSIILFTVLRSRLSNNIIFFSSTAAATAAASNRKRITCFSVRPFEWVRPARIKLFIREVYTIVFVCFTKPSSNCTFLWRRRTAVRRTRQSDLSANTFDRAEHVI